MRYLLLLFSVVLFKKVYSQSTAVYEDDRKFFYVFQNNRIERAEILPVKEYYVGNKYVAYVDNRNQFKLYFDHKKYTILPIPPDKIAANDYLLSYIQAGILGVFDGVKSKTVSGFLQCEKNEETGVTSCFAQMKDSILAYVDVQSNFKVYENLENKSLEDWGNTEFYTGDNIVAYYDVQGRFKIYYAGNIIEAESFKPYNVFIAKDLVAYNDYLGNFKVFYKGEFYPLENYKVFNPIAVNGTLIYSTNTNEFTAFTEGKKNVLLNQLPRFYKNYRNMFVFSDMSNRFYMLYNGKKTLLENFTPTDFQLDDDVLVYKDLQGRLKGVIDGIPTQITDQIVIDYKVFNKSITYYELNQNQTKIWSQGNIYQYIETDQKY